VARTHVRRHIFGLRSCYFADVGCCAPGSVVAIQPRRPIVAPPFRRSFGHRVVSGAAEEEGAVMQGKYARVSGVVFGVVAVIQALRLFNRWPVQVGPFAVPVGFSWLALLLAGGLCIWAFGSGHR
jgi:hypothetical protein